MEQYLARIVCSVVKNKKVTLLTVSHRLSTGPHHVFRISLVRLQMSHTWDALLVELVSEGSALTICLGQRDWGVTDCKAVG